MSKRSILPMYLFPFLKETAFLSNKALKVTYESGFTSYDILFEGSKDLPRKQKKKLRKLIG